MNPFAALEDGDIAQVKALVTAANVNNGNEDGQTLLHVACDKGNIPLVSWLLNSASGVDVNAQDASGFTPLHYCISSLEIMRLLLDHGADATIGDNCLVTPLHVAAEGGLTQAAAMLLEAFPNAIHCVDEHRRTPLCLAVIEGCKECAVLLLDRGSDIDSRDYANQTPLRFALMMMTGNVHMSHLLMERGARLENVVLDEFLTCIPPFAQSFHVKRSNSRRAAFAILGLRKRQSLVIGPNGRDVLLLVATRVWFTRWLDEWTYQ